MPRPDTVFICTGEASGDLHAANLITALRAARPDIVVTGLGGPRMAEAGCQLRVNLLGLAAMWHKAATQLTTFVPLLSLTDRQFANAPPDAVVILDYPGFNFPLARRATSRGIPVLYYIPPQMWAWGQWRMAKLKARVRRVACIFAFEEAMYRQAGVPVRHVGHPLVDALGDLLDRPDHPAATAAVFAPAEGRPRIGLLPGSRRQEIETLLPVMLDIAAAVRAKFAGAVFSLGCADPSLRELIHAIVRRASGAGLAVDIHDRASHAIMRQADLLLVASGTATLEAGLLGTPMVILYSISRWLYHGVARHLIRSPHIGLANVVAGRRVVPEFAPVLPPMPTMIAEVLHLLDDPSRLAAMRRDLAAVRANLGGPGASARAAEEVLALVDESRARHRDGRRRGTPNCNWVW